MPPHPVNSNRAFTLLASIVLVVGALYWAQRVLIPIALAVLLTFILAPLVAGLQKRGLGRLLSVFVVVLTTFALLAGIGAVLTRELNSLMAELPQHKDNIAKRISELREMSQGTVFEEAQHMVRELMDELTTRPEPEPVLVRIYTSGFDQIQAAIGPAAEALANSALVVVLLLFMLVQREDLRNRFVRLSAHGNIISATRAIDEATRRISRYLLAQVLVNAGVGLVLGIGLFFLGVPYAALWAVLVGLLRFVPYVGAWITAVMLLGFSFFTAPGWSGPLSVAALFLTLELFAANVVEPLTFGHNTGISSIALLIAAAFWTWLWGPIGLILATPITVCLVVLGKYVRELEFFDVLLGDEPALDVDVRYYQRLLARDQDEAIELVEDYLLTHPPESVFDGVLLPALVLAKHDKERGELSDEDEEFILSVTRELLEDLRASRAAVAKDRPAADEATAARRAKVKIVGCPAQDTQDELALHMFRMVLEPAGFHVEVLPATTLTAEVLSRLHEEGASLVCIAAVPPGGTTKARYLTKRLRLEFPDLKIHVGRWGSKEPLGRTGERLLSAGANLVATSLLESRDQVVPLLQALSHTREAVETA